MAGLRWLRWRRICLQRIEPLLQTVPQFALGAPPQHPILREIEVHLFVLTDRENDSFFQSQRIADLQITIRSSTGKVSHYESAFGHRLKHLGRDQLPPYNASAFLTSYSLCWSSGCITPSYADFK